MTDGRGIQILDVDTRWYPAATLDGNPAEPVGPIRYVLVAGQIGDYACYAGAGAAEWVARFGDKISFEEACGHFPGGQLVRERYRA